MAEWALMQWSVVEDLPDGRVAVTTYFDPIAVPSDEYDKYWPFLVPDGRPPDGGSKTVILKRDDEAPSPFIELEGREGKWLPDNGNAN